jgi:hypothetical protein
MFGFREPLFNFSRSISSPFSADEILQMHNCLVSFGTEVVTSSPVNEIVCLSNASMPQEYFSFFSIVVGMSEHSYFSQRKSCTRRDFKLKENFATFLVLFHSPDSLFTSLKSIFMFLFIRLLILKVWQEWNFRKSKYKMEKFENSETPIGGLGRYKTSRYQLESLCS